MIWAALAAFAGGAAGAALVAIMAWPKDKARIIADLENGIGGLLHVEAFLEELYERTGDPEVKEAWKRIRIVLRSWRRIRAQDFEQGKLFHEDDQG